MKPYFDAVVVVPLEEEFQTALSDFTFTDDRSTSQHIRFAASIPGSDLSILLVKQNTMGKTESQNAVLKCLDDYDAGMLICLGIAGGISSDVAIGDVCYTGTVIDLLDNAKAAGGSHQSAGRSSSRTDLAFSPTYFSSPIEIAIAINLDRISPETKNEHESWLAAREAFGRGLISGEFTGKGGKRERLGTPNLWQGTIACGAVSDSVDYNKKIRAVDRKVLALDTESGGLFSIAKLRNLPAFTVRGISDYAGFGLNKTQFEDETNNKARVVAASNAASFLARQFARPRVVRCFNEFRKNVEGHQLNLIAISPVDKLADALTSQGQGFDARLRDLAPGYGLQAKGYRLPVPRVRIVNDHVGTPDDTVTDPMEIRDALRQGRVLVVQVPPQYPDLSLPWIIGRDLLLTQVGNKQLLPCVIEGSAIRRPRDGIRLLAGDQILAFANVPETEIVYVIDDFNFESRTRTEFLRQEVDDLPGARFIIVTRNRPNVLLESEFITKAAAIRSFVCDVSFSEIFHFLQKNFEMAGAAAEVVATRLRETFQSFKLPIHPTYFAGIPANALSALLQANRRAELIEIAVVGYLSYVVSQDDEPVSLSRTTRESFLTAVAYEINVEKKCFSETELVAFADSFAKRYDFKISPARFVAAFIAKGILHIESEKVRFTLPFIESYLLAKKLFQEPELALKYFIVGDDNFDLQTFAISAELGVPKQFIASLLDCMDKSIEQLRQRAETPPILTGDTLFPSLLARQDRLQTLQKRIHDSFLDVLNDKDKALEKQKLLDANDRIRERAARLSVESDDKATEEKEQQISIESNALAAWAVAVQLLGAGAERLEAEVKRKFVRKILALSALIVEDWTRQQAKIDFKELKEELLADESGVSQLAKSESETDIQEARRTIAALVELLEYSFLARPFHAILSSMCEEARENVLAESIVNTKVEDDLEALIRAIWLSDIEANEGSKEVKRALKRVQKARFLRVALANHLMVRVYWKHWNKDHRLKLLELADEALQDTGLMYNKAGMKRLIEKGSQVGDDLTD